MDSEPTDICDMVSEVLWSLGLAGLTNGVGERRFVPFVNGDAAGYSELLLEDNLRFGLVESDAEGDK